ncbi:hypothetical protein CYFUS_001021 [Cystobacter fuscus]|uniref:Uncharacterized protein n=1 Tax=Cystobacter fuscus TaxID=43 RepID=A0A250IWL6_9BACT|nr:hypothetical protein [Cystobacter fuscus]ATB35607.1 hypothetical protein CYFUS_001021 [Cystobacter fuscus]
MDRQRRIVLGPDVPLLEDSEGQGAPVQVRTLVQDHWKRQAHGPGLAERKLIWIQPYWRGPDAVPPPSPAKHVLV